MTLKLSSQAAGAICWVGDEKNQSEWLGRVTDRAESFNSRPERLQPPSVPILLLGQRGISSQPPGSRVGLCSLCLCAAVCVAVE